MPLAEGLLLWLRHCLAAEHDTRGLPRSFLHYSDLLADWRPVVDRLAAELGLVWPVPPAAAAPEIDAFLSGELRHHAAGEGEALAGPPRWRGWSIPPGRRSSTLPPAVIRTAPWLGSTPPAPRSMPPTR